MGLRLVITLLGIWLIYYLISKAFRKRQAGQTRPPTQPAEDMVRCAKCGIHLPRSEAIAHGNDFYCSSAHLPAVKRHGAATQTTDSTSDRTGGPTDDR